MGSKSDLIQDQIKEAKADLSRNLDYLENHIRQTVTETFDTVKSELRALTPAQQIQQNPIWALGGSLLAGAALGGWVGSRATETIHPHSPSLPLGSRTLVGRGIFDEEIRAIKEVAVAALVRGIGKKAREMAPDWEHQINDIVDRVTAKLDTWRPAAADSRADEPNLDWAPQAGPRSAG